MKLLHFRSRCRARALWLGVFLVRFLTADSRAEDGYWDSRFGYYLGTPTCIAIDSSDRLVLGWSNWKFYGIPDASTVLRWDGRRWETLAAGVINSVNALLPTETNLIIAGKFSNIGAWPGLTNIAISDGTAWRPLGPGLPGAVFALARDESAVVAGGDFLTTNQTRYANVARWDGQQWLAMGSGVPGRVLSLVSSTNGEFYAASDGVNGQTPASVWRWSGQDWTKIGDFGDAGARRVRRLTWTSDILFAALAPADASPCVMQWRGNQWSPVGDVPLSGTAEAFATSDGVLTVGGVLSWVRDGETNKAAIARLVNGRWEADLSLPSRSVFDLASRGRETYAVGLMNDGIGDTNSSNVWHHDGVSWGQLYNGLTFMNETYRVAEYGSRLIVLGESLKSELAPGLVWNGRMWIKLGISPAPGFTLRVSPLELAVVGTNLYAGGIASSSATGPTNVLVRLVGTNWVQASDGFPFPASAICGTGDRVFVGGRLTTGLGGSGAVEEWDGRRWRQLGGLFSVGVSVPGFSISSLFLFHDTLHAAGMFTSADGSAITNLALWDGQNWRQVGQPLDGPIVSVSVVDQRVYVVGPFTKSNTTPLNQLAVWDGSIWSSLGSRVGFFEEKFTVAGRADGVVAAGGYRGGMYEIWVWKNNDWTRAGVFDQAGNYSTFAPQMIWTGHDLNTSGRFFTMMGSFNSDCFAIWHDAPALAELAGYDSSGASLKFTGALPTRFTVERTSNLGSWTPIATNTPANPAEIFVDPEAVTNPTGYYRAASRP